MEKLYKKLKNSTDFVCTETGKKCERVTQHFAEFNRFLKKKGMEPRYVHARNLCEETNCPIWQKLVKERAKVNQR